MRVSSRIPLLLLFSYLVYSPLRANSESINESIDVNDETTESFSYCNEGLCRLTSAKELAQVQNLPLDLHHKCKKDMQYALSFDDGPSANTERLLAILDHHKIKATFFIIGANLRNPEGRLRVQHIYRKGHQVSNHTLSHRSLDQLSPEDILNEVMSTQHLLIKILGYDDKIKRDSRVVRPPYGHIDQRVQDTLKSIGFSAVRWNADRYDWKLKIEDRELLHRRFEQQLALIDAQPSGSLNRSILDLNHERQDVTLSLLDEWIPQLKARGYEFVSLSECIGLEN